ncbi:hypothetical protein [Streptomyces antimycoticus]|uniref:hypothetical protein n=1 Tax=Streptomyces antimycoticus TaxID=68175 RepID=UPI000A3BC7C0|nr:hypothetical protein [Streptomyces antimycoticus]
MSAEPVPWAQLAAAQETVTRYRAKIHQRDDDRCAYWLGAISDSGHGKLRAGRRSDGTSRVVTAHVLGFVIEYGPQALRADDVVRHTCDEASCQNRRHWTTGSRRDNNVDYHARVHRAGHALADVRGPAGRAIAIRTAILAADPDDVEDAIAAAIAAGNPTGARQDTLW